MTSYFTERQKFTQAWLWILLAGATVYYFSLRFQSIHQNLSLESGSPIEGVLLISDIVFVLLWVLFLTAALHTEIKENGLHYKFFPFHWRYRHIPWTDIKTMEIREYRPIAEYLGWGIRFGTGGNAYNVKGSMGLQLVLKNGKRILFGTQHPEELQQAIKRIRTKHKIKE